MRTDVHTHLIPPVTAEVAATVGLARTPQGRLARGDHAFGPPGLYDAAALVAWLDAASLDRALVSTPPPTYRQGHGAAESRVWARALNDALAAMVADQPRLVPLGYLPLDHPELAVEEAERLVADGWVGFTGSAGGRSVPLDDPRFEPLWQLLTAGNRPLLLHPGTTPDERMTPHYLDNLLGNPVETGLAAGQLLLGGVLAAHPGLRIALVHCGGVVPAVLGRWQRGMDTRRPGLTRQDADLRAEARALWLDTLAHDRTLVDAAVAMVGVEHLLLGSDWPFPMGSDRPLDDVAHLGADAVQQIATDNAARFLQG